jgi:hypothetical protein
MASEQARGNDVGPETDILGVRATMFALLTDQPVHASAPPPFDVDSSRPGPPDRGARRLRRREGSFASVAALT